MAIVHRLINDVRLECKKTDKLERLFVTVGAYAKDMSAVSTGA